MRCLRGETVETPAFFETWGTMADKLVGLADEDEAKGRAFSAGVKLNRASLYYQVAERMQSHGFAPRERKLSSKGIASFKRSIALSKAPCEFVDIPYEGKCIPGLLTLAPEAAHVVRRR